MGAGNSNPNDVQDQQRSLLASRIYGGGQQYNWNKPSNWQQMTPDQQQAWLKQAGANLEKWNAGMMGKDYIPVGQTRALNAAPLAPDAFDTLLAKRRSSAMLLAGAGMGRSSTFMSSAGTGTTPRLSSTLLGGY